MEEGRLKLSPELVSIVDSLRGGGSLLSGVLVNILVDSFWSAFPPGPISVDLSLVIVIISIDEPECVSGYKMTL